MKIPPPPATPRGRHIRPGGRQHGPTNSMEEEDPLRLAGFVPEKTDLLKLDNDNEKNGGGNSFGGAGGEEDVKENKDAAETKESGEAKDAGSAKRADGTVPAEGKKRDGFEVGRQRIEELKKAAQAHETRNSDAIKVEDMPPQPPGNDPIKALNNSQPPGVFFVEEGAAQEQLDPELVAAVEELRELLRELPGIGKIFASKNELEIPIVVVSVKQGVTDLVLGQIPPTARRFPTSIAVPFDLLPIKRDRGGLAAPSISWETT